jgi:hypothetical protein
MPCIDVVLDRMCGPAQRNLTSFAINKQRTGTCVEVFDCRASQCRTAVVPGDDPSQSRSSTAVTTQTSSRGDTQEAKYTSASSRASAASKSHDMCGR